MKNEKILDEIITNEINFKIDNLLHSLSDNEIVEMIQDQHYLETNEYVGTDVVREKLMIEVRELIKLLPNLYIQV
jgi:hypothetical protein